MNEPSLHPHYRSALAAIWERSGYDRGFISNPFAGDEAARLGLRRTRRLLDHLGAPDTGPAIVHVAGSNGKGSTCAFVDAIVRAAGYRVGRYTSPHLHQFRERFAVGGEPITESDFADHFFTTLRAAEAVERDQPTLGTITAFELTTAMAFAVFADHDCELAVIETGMGGTLDATNVLSPLVSVISPLDYEHTAVLGTTMTEIARNKAGIIKPRRPVAVAAQPAAALAVIEERAVETGSPLLLAGRDWHTTGSWERFTAVGPWGHLDALRSGLVGPHQVDNAGLALAACALLTKDGFRFPHQSLRAGIAATVWPGRFEEVSLAAGQRVVIDGAHSPAAAAVLAEAIKSRFPGQRAAFVIGLLGDKEPRAFVEPLMPLAASWHVAKPSGPRGRPAQELRAALSDVQPAPTAAGSVAEAIGHAATTGSSLVVVTGSLSTAGEARVALGLATNDPAP
jgi:dihydrofolate synthase/folylpolyglutamate synthase